MATSNNQLNILITLTNQTKDTLGEILQGLASIQSSVDGLGQNSAGGIDKLGNQLQEVAKHTGEASEAAKEAEGGFKGFIEKLNGATEAVKFFAGGFLAMEFAETIKEIADVAARTETLGIVLQTVGQNAGYTAQQLSEADAAVRSMGITAEASRQSLTQLIQAGLSVDFAPQLARAAQDLAVISGQNSSQTFQRLVDNIQQMDTLGLRFMGIMVDRQQVMAQATADVGHALTQTQEKQAFMNAVLAESTKLTGTYENAMQSAGKALSSMSRYVENFKDALGENMQPVYLQLILGTEHVIEALTNLAKAFTEAAPNADLFGDAYKNAAEEYSPLAEVIKKVADSIVDFVNFLRDNKDFIAESLSVIRDSIYSIAILGGGLAVIGGLTKLIEIATPVVAAVRGIAVTMGLIEGASAAAAGGIAAVEGAAVAAEGATAAMGAGLLATLGPIAAVVLAVGGLAAAYSYLSSSSEEAKHHVEIDLDTVVQDYKDALKAVEDAKRANDQAQATLTKQANLLTNDPTDESQQNAVKQARADAEAAKKALKEAQEELHHFEEALANSEELKYQDALKEQIKKVAEAHAENEKAINAEKQAQAELSKTLQAAGIDYQEYLNGISEKNSNAFKGLSEGIRELGKLNGENIGDSILATLEGGENLSSGVRTEAELKKFIDLMTQLDERAKQFGLDIHEQVEGSITNARSAAATFAQDRALGGRARAAEQAGVDRRAAQQNRADLLQEADEEKLRQQKLLDIDKEAYAHGLVDLNDYYDARQKAIETNAQYEQRAQLAYIQGLLNDRYNTSDTVKQAQIDRQIAEAHRKLMEAGDKADEQITQNQIARLEARLKLEQDVAKAAQEVNQNTGNGDLAVAQQIDDARRKELETVKALGSAEAERIVNRKYDIELEQKQAAQAVADLDRELSLRRAVFDLAESQAKVALDAGQITSNENQAIQNELARQRITALQQEFDLQQQIKQNALDAGDALGADKASTKLAQLQKQMVDLSGTIKTFGDTLRTTFADSFATNLQSALEKAQSFRDGLSAVWKDINTAIMKNITKDIAESLTRSIDNAFKDDKGNGTFDRLGQAVDGVPLKNPDLSKNNEALTAESVGKGAAETYTPEVATRELIDETVKAANYGSRTADATEAMYKQMVDAERQREANRADNKGYGTVNPGITAGKGDGAVGGAAKNEPFDYATALEDLDLGKGGIKKPDFDKAFDDAAKKAGLDLYGYNGDMLRHIATVESRMNPNAESPAGALGVMQIMPETGKALGLSEDDLRDPIKNINAAAQILAENLKRRNGDIDQALSDYNAGPKATNAAIAKGFDFAQNKETTAYVGRLGSDGVGAREVSAEEPKNLGPTKITGGAVDGNFVSVPIYNAAGDVVGYTQEPKNVTAPDVASKGTGGDVSNFAVLDEASAPQPKPKSVSGVDLSAVDELGRPISGLVDATKDATDKTKAHTEATQDSESATKDATASERQSIASTDDHTTATHAATDAAKAGTVADQDAAQASKANADAQKDTAGAVKASGDAYKGVGDATKAAAEGSKTLGQAATDSATAQEDAKDKTDGLGDSASQAGTALDNSASQASAAGTALAGTKDAANSAKEGVDAIGKAHKDAAPIINATSGDTKTMGAAASDAALAIRDLSDAGAAAGAAIGGLKGSGATGGNSGPDSTPAPAERPADAPSSGGDISMAGGGNGDTASDSDVEAAKRAARGAVDPAAYATGGNKSSGTGGKKNWLESIGSDLLRSGETLLGATIGREIGGKYGATIGALLGRQLSKIDMKDIEDFFGKFKNKIKDGFDTTTKDAEKNADDTNKAIDKSVSDTQKTVADGAEQTQQTVAQGAEDTQQSIATGAQQTQDDIALSAKDIQGEIQTSAENINQEQGDSFAQVSSDLGGELQSIATTADTGFADVSDSSVSGINDLTSGIGDNLDSGFSDLSSQASDGGFGISDFFSGFGDTLLSGFAGLAGIVGSIFGGSKGGREASQAVGLVSSAYNTYKTGSAAYNWLTGGSTAAAGGAAAASSSLGGTAAVEAGASNGGLAGVLGGTTTTAAGTAAGTTATGTAAAGATTTTAAAGTADTAAGSSAAGAIGGAGLAAVGFVALGAYLLANWSDGEKSLGNQLQYDPTKGVQNTQWGRQGVINNDGTTMALNDSITQLNQLLSQFGTGTQVGSLNAGTRTSDDNQAFTYAGGYLSNGQSFGQLGGTGKQVPLKNPDGSIKTDGYGNPIYGVDPSANEGVTNHGTVTDPTTMARNYIDDLDRSVLSALQNSHLVGDVGNYLAQLGDVTKLTTEQLAAAMAYVRQAAASITDAQRAVQAAATASAPLVTVPPPQPTPDMGGDAGQATSGPGATYTPDNGGDAGTSGGGAGAIYTGSTGGDGAPAPTAYVADAGGDAGTSGSAQNSDDFHKGILRYLSSRLDLGDVLHQYLMGRDWNSMSGDELTAFYDNAVVLAHRAADQSGIQLAFAEGGLVTGPGTGTSDSINARLSNGEFVIPAEVTKKYLPMLEALRTGRFDDMMGNLFGGMHIAVPQAPAYASGGLVASNNSVAASPVRRSGPVNIYVTTKDADSFRRSKDQIVGEYNQALKRTDRRDA
jgi:hypothetical protein